MADDKKKYWMKMEFDFFERDEIKIIESMPNGNEYILFLLKLMLKSLRTEGHLKVTAIIPYDAKMLATTTNTNIDIVRSAVKILQDMGVIEILPDDTIFIPEVPKKIGKESESAERVRRHRAKIQAESIHIKALQSNIKVTTLHCNDNKDKEKYKEKDKQFVVNTDITNIRDSEKFEKQQQFENFKKEFPQIIIDTEFGFEHDILLVCEKLKESKDWLLNPNNSFKLSFLIENYDALIKNFYKDRDLPKATDKQQKAFIPRIVN